MAYQAYIPDDLTRQLDLLVRRLGPGASRPVALRLALARGMDFLMSTLPEPSMVARPVTEPAPTPVAELPMETDYPAPHESGVVPLVTVGGDFVGRPKEE